MRLAQPASTGRSRFSRFMPRSERHSDVGKLVDIVTDLASGMPAAARPVLTVMAQSLQALQEQIALPDRENRKPGKGRSRGEAIRVRSAHMGAAAA